VEWVSIGPPLGEESRIPAAYGPRGGDLVLNCGEGLTIHIPESVALTNGAAMVQEALAELMGSQPQKLATQVQVTVDEPPASEWPARESYHLEVDKRGVRIHAPAQQGAFWGMMTLIDLMRNEAGGRVRIQAVKVQDQPDLPWRVGTPPGALGTAAEQVNTVKKLARLKLNMACVAVDDLEAARADSVERFERLFESLRAHGIEPIAVVGLGRAAMGLDVQKSVMGAAIEKLQARYLAIYDISFFVGGSSIGDGIEELCRFLRGLAPQTCLILPDLELCQSEAPNALLATLPEEAVVMCEAWDPEIREALSGLVRVRYLYQVGYKEDPREVAAQAASDRDAGRQCLGLVGVGKDLAAIAGAAWRVRQ